MNSEWLQILLDKIKVDNTGQKIRVTGIRTGPFFTEMTRVFGTVRFQNGMVTGITSSAFSVSKFFLFDFYNLVVAFSEAKRHYFRKDLLKKLVAEFNKLPEIRRITETFPSNLNPKALDRFKFTPLPHQETFFKEYDQNTQKYGLNGYILASGPGSGKTLSSLMLMAMLDTDIVIIFSPKNALQEVWADTLANMKGTDPWVYPAPIVKKSYTHYVFNHENTKFAMAALDTVFRQNKGKKIGIIVDECHKFTELAADQTQNLIEICQDSKSTNILFMSGTPFKALGRELLPFLMATDPTFTEADQAGFRKIFGVSGLAAIDILSARIGRTLYQIATSDIVQNDVTEFQVKVKVPNGERFTLPSIKKKMEAFIRERYVYYGNNREALHAEYHRIIKQFSQSETAKKDPKRFEIYKNYVEIVRDADSLRDVVDEIKYTNQYEKKEILPTLSSADKVIFKNVKSVYKYLALKIQGEALGRVLGTERTECNLQIVRHIDDGMISPIDKAIEAVPWSLEDVFQTSESKVVMFTDFIQVVQLMNSELKKKGYKPEMVYGETNSELVAIIDRFKNDPKIDPIIATYPSLSTAVPLIMASSVILLNLPFRQYIYEQATARVDRLGQQKAVRIYQYQLDTGNIPNISTRSKDIMAWSKQMVQELLGIATDETASEIEEEFVNGLPEGFVKTNESLFRSW